METIWGNKNAVLRANHLDYLYGNAVKWRYDSDDGMYTLSSASV
jgi:hypothetical protein